MPGSERVEGPITVRLTEAQRKAVAEVIPAFSGRLKLDERGARSVSFKPDELKAIRHETEKAVPRADTGVKRNSLRHVVEAVKHALEGSKGLGAIPPSERVYQFKITLQDSKPRIWRRIQVKDCTLDKLHEYIQTAMGWTNSHLHHFRIDGKLYGDPMLMAENFFDMDYADSTVTRVSEILPPSGKRFRFEYEYDFGDSWYHEVLFEGCPRAEPGRRYPICVEGARACPPEDVGGVWGYSGFVEAIADPGHEEHESYLEWVGGSFDPEEFDPAKATREMRRGLPNWRD
jgi:hypothetical protein